MPSKHYLDFCSSKLELLPKWNAKLYILPTCSDLAKQEYLEPLQQYITLSFLILVIIKTNLFPTLYTNLLASMFPLLFKIINLHQNHVLISFIYCCFFIVNHLLICLNSIVYLFQIPLSSHSISAQFLKFMCFLNVLSSLFYFSCA